MGVRENFQKRIDAKRAENAEFEARIRENKAYIQALEDALRLLPRTADMVVAKPPFRGGSLLARTHTLLRRSGRPLHVNEILETLGRTANRNNKAGLSGTLAAYVRKGEIFTRPAPNTFGLLEFGNAQEPAPEPTQEELTELVESLRK